MRTLVLGFLGAVVVGGLAVGIVAVQPFGGRSSDDGEAADQHLTAGVEHGDAGRWEEALAEYNAAIDLDPDIAQA